MLHSPCEGREQIKKQGSEANASEPLFFSDMAVIRRKVLEIAFYVAHTPSFLAPVREKMVPVPKKMGYVAEKRDYKVMFRK